MTREERHIVEHSIRFKTNNPEYNPSLIWKTIKIQSQSSLLASKCVPLRNNLKFICHIEGRWRYECWKSTLHCQICYENALHCQICHENALHCQIKCYKKTHSIWSDNMLERHSTLSDNNPLHYRNAKMLCRVPRTLCIVR